MLEQQLSKQCQHSETIVLEQQKEEKVQDQVRKTVSQGAILS